MLYVFFCAPSVLSHVKLCHLCGLKYNLGLLSYRIILAVQCFTNLFVKPVWASIPTVCLAYKQNISLSIL